jgi:hypothetical protein
MSINLKAPSTTASSMLIADNVNQNSTNGSPDCTGQPTKFGGSPASAALEIQSTKGGVLIPRMTTAEINALNSGNAMMVYDTTLNVFKFYQNGAYATYSTGGGGGEYSPGEPTFIQDTFDLATDNLSMGTPPAHFGSGTDITIIGIEALLLNTIGSSLTGVGYGVLGINDTGDDNTGVGTNCLASNVEGSGNTAVGSESSTVSNANNNTSIGFQSLNINADGDSNSALGDRAGAFLVHGDHNTFCGDLSGGNVAATLNDCSFLGTNASAGVDGLTNATAIGANAIVEISDAIVLGDSTIPTKVGIGTNIPEDTLHVIGSVQFRGLVDPLDNYNNPGLIFNQYTKSFSGTHTFAFPMPSPLTLPTQMTVTATICLLRNGGPDTAAFAVSTSSILYDGTSYILLTSGTPFALTGNLSSAATADWYASPGFLNLLLDVGVMAGGFFAVVSTQTSYLVDTF